MTERLKLNSVDIEDDSGNVIETYDFGYNVTHILPDFLATSRDLWGYFNNQSNERSGIPTLVPRHVINYQPTAASSSNTIEIGSSNANGRSSNETYMQACVLNEITFPTGGWTEFDYESNRYLDGSTPVVAGGLRIAQMRTYDKVGATPIKQTFKYGVGESGIGRTNFLAGRYTFDNEVTHRSASGATNFCASMRSRTYVSSPSIALEPFDQAPVVYPEVSVYSGDISNNIGKTIYEFWDYGDTPGPGFQIGTPTVESNHFRRGQLKRKRSYRFDGGSNYTLVQEVNNTYGAFGLCQNGKMGLKVTKLFINGSDAYLGVNPNNNLNDSQSFLYAFYRVIRGDDRLLSSEEINYSDTGTPYTVLTEYFYDRYDHQQVTFTNTTSSKGESLTKEIYYPHDVSGSVYIDMVANHQIASPVIETSLRGNIEVQKTVRNYHEPVVNIFEPQTITTQQDGGKIYTEGTFHSYDSYGNLTSFTGRDGIEKSILWSFDGHYPVVVADHINLTALQSAVNNSLPSGFTSLQALVEDMSNIASSSSAQVNWKLFNENLRAQASMAGAYIQTFTNNPTVGQTSSTDVTGLTTYYGYDPYNRLYQVKDFQGNVLQEHKYNFHNN